MTLGQIISEYLATNNMTAVELSKRSGLSRSYISLLVNERKVRNKSLNPSADTVFALAKAMHVSPDKLFDRLDGDYQVVVNTVDAKEIPILLEYNPSNPINMQKRIISYMLLSDAYPPESKLFALEIQNDDFSPAFIKNDVIVCELTKEFEKNVLYIYFTDKVNIGSYLSSDNESVVFAKSGITATLDMVKQRDIIYYARIHELKRRF